MLCCQKKLISVRMIILKLMAFLRKHTCSRMTNEGRSIIWHMVSIVAGTMFWNRRSTISWILKIIKFMFFMTSQFYLIYCLDLFYPYGTLGNFREESWGFAEHLQIHVWKHRSFWANYIPLIVLCMRWHMV